MRTVSTDLDGEHELLVFLLELLGLNQVVGTHEAGCQHGLPVTNPADHLRGKVRTYMCSRFVMYRSLTRLTYTASHITRMRCVHTQTHTPACTHTCMHTNTHRCTHTHTHSDTDAGIHILFPFVLIPSHTSMIPISIFLSHIYTFSSQVIVSYA